MKVALGQKKIDAAWGGGNQFILSLSNYLSRHGVKVVYDLLDDDIDIILVTDPRSNNPLVSFTLRQVLFYKWFHNPDVVVVHRINECDERKGTRFMNFLLRCANSLSEHTIFISEWLMSLNVYVLPLNQSSVIRNGANKAIFFGRGQKISDSSPIKLVTHHWSGHENKGWQIYREINSRLNYKDFSNRYTFTYIGTASDQDKLMNINFIKPLFGRALRDELVKHDVYVTGSIYEPAGMHHVEAACCGLPIMFCQQGGGIPEYCATFGLGFKDPEDFFVRLDDLVSKLPSFKERLEQYPYTSDKMCSEYLELFVRLQISDRRKEFPTDTSSAIKNKFYNACALFV